MKFQFEQFSCDVDVFYKEQDVLLRFYDVSKEQSESEIMNLVIVDPGYGYLCIKFKGDSALLSGYLDDKIFHSDEIVEALLHYIEDLFPHTRNMYMPYHIKRVRESSYVEYNGEY
ncbi:hypothetical protein [Paenibacillus kandeliae]|uniref:hypothetical protein n=1 Tax=Paenibacillus kandeliae TaxID=3231269 RepID=UPI003459A53B